MESTGEYWKPIDHLLEGDLTVFLVHAAPVKNVPGRKTDRADARWLAKLMRHGVRQARFIPAAAPRELRDLPRYRTKLVQERTREVNRVQGVLERAQHHVGVGGVGYDGRVGAGHPGGLDRRASRSSDDGGVGQRAPAGQDAGAWSRR